MEIDATTNQRLHLIHLPVKKGSVLEEKCLRNCGIRRDGLIVVGIKDSDNKFQFAPDADHKFTAGHSLIALGSQESCDKVRKLLE